MNTHIYIQVANDAMFTEADFRSLTRIGQGSKIEKLASTGRFGLGFSSTYHLTDTPCFVSGGHLVIFDPHCEFPGANSNQPGLRIKLKGSTLPSTFKDQFAPFLHFGCDFNEEYQGTLFRFPLRTPSMARRSEISKRSYTTQDIQNNLNQLVSQLSHHLLFLRSVKTIEIYRCGENEKPFLLHKASSSITDIESHNDQSLLKFFDKKAVASPPRDVFYNRLLATPDHKLPTTSQKVKIAVNSFNPLPPSSLSSGIYPPPTSPLQIVSPASGQVSTSESSTPPPPHQSISTTQSDGNSVQDIDSVSTPIRNLPIMSQQDSIEYIVVHGLMGGGAKRMACDEKVSHYAFI
jgi:hypothetical protein